MVGGRCNPGERGARDIEGRGVFETAASCVPVAPSAAHTIDDVLICLEPFGGPAGTVKTYAWVPEVHSKYGRPR